MIQDGDQFVPYHIVQPTAMRAILRDDGIVEQCRSYNTWIKQKAMFPI